MATILVIDDEMGIRELLSEILDDEGHEVFLAENAKQGRVAYAHCEPDLVLLDIWMPDTDGMTLLREWTSSGSGESGSRGLICPVIMMSGHASIETAAEAQDLGASDFLEKPITLHKLLSSVHKCLARHAKAADTAQLTTSTASLNLPSPNASALSDGQNAYGTKQASAEALGEMDARNKGQIRTTPTGAHSNSHQVDTGEPAISLGEWEMQLSKIDLHAPLREARDQLERIYFTHLIKKERGAITRVAELCGLERTHLYRKLKQLNIDIVREPKS